MNEVKIGDELMGLHGGAIYGGPLIDQAALEQRKLSDKEMRAREEHIKKGHERLMRQRRAVLVINFAQQIYLLGVSSGVPYSVEGAIGTAEKLITAGEEYLKKAGEE